MRRFIKFLGCSIMAVYTLQPISAGGIKKVHDKDNYNQVRSMEVAGWGFTPESDYYSWYKKKIDLGITSIKIKVPGNGWHENGFAGTGINVVPNVLAGLAGRPEAILTPDHYVDQRWRLMSGQRVPAVTQSILQKNHMTQAQKDWTSMLQDDIITIADREGVISGALSLGSSDITKNDRENACYIIDNYINEIKSRQLKEIFKREYDRLKDEISVIQGAHIDDAKKTIQLTACNNRLEQLAKEIQNQRFIDEMDGVLQDIIGPAENRVKKFLEKHGWAGNLLQHYFLSEQSPFKIEEESKRLLESLIDMKKL